MIPPKSPRGGALTWWHAAIRGGAAGRHVADDRRGFVDAPTAAPGRPPQRRASSRARRAGGGRGGGLPGRGREVDRRRHVRRLPVAERGPELRRRHPAGDGPAQPGGERAHRASHRAGHRRGHRRGGRHLRPGRHREHAHHRLRLARAGAVLRDDPGAGGPPPPVPGRAGGRGAAQGVRGPDAALPGRVGRGVRAGGAAAGPARARRRAVRGPPLGAGHRHQPVGGGHDDAAAAPAGARGRAGGGQDVAAVAAGRGRPPVGRHRALRALHRRRHRLAAADPPGPRPVHRRPVRLAARRAGAAAASWSAWRPSSAASWSRPARPGPTTGPPPPPCSTRWPSGWAPPAGCGRSCS